MSGTRTLYPVMSEREARAVMSTLLNAYPVPADALIVARRLGRLLLLADQGAGVVQEEA